MSVSDEPVHQPRRRDRARSDAWIRAFMRQAPWGFLATVSDGRPFLNSNLFVYVEEEHAIFLHTARTGQTRELMRERTRVTFSAAVMGRLLPADTALEFSVEFAAVVAFGTGRTLEGEEEKRLALQQLLDKYAPQLRPGRDYRPITSDELRRTAVYRLDVEAWSGKEKAAPLDFPGAFLVPPPPIPLREEDAGA